MAVSRADVVTQKNVCRRVRKQGVQAMSRMAISLLRLFLILSLSSPGISSDAQNRNQTSVTKQDYEAVVSSPEDEIRFDAFLEKLPTVVVPGQPPRTYYILEGDLLLTREQVKGRIRSYADEPRPVVPGGELNALTQAGSFVRWPRNARNLTYAIDRQSFQNDAEYKEVKTNMAAAAKAWMDACPNCGVTISHRAEFDANATLKDVTFVVRMDARQGDFVAVSFFPNDPIYRRYLIVSQDYFDSKFDHTGVLRHELGHILGYRHEHIGMQGCYWEDDQWKPLTSYDRLSVMHYFCGGGGTLQLQLSKKDIESHAKHYALSAD